MGNFIDILDSFFGLFTCGDHTYTFSEILNMGIISKGIGYLYLAVAIITPVVLCFFKKFASAVGFVYSIISTLVLTGFIHFKILGIDEPEHAAYALAIGGCIGLLLAILSAVFLIFGDNAGSFVGCLLIIPIIRVILELIFFLIGGIVAGMFGVDFIFAIGLFFAFAAPTSTIIVVIIRK